MTEEQRASDTGAKAFTVAGHSLKLAAMLLLMFLFTATLLGYVSAWAADGFSDRAAYEEYVEIEVRDEIERLFGVDYEDLSKVGALVCQDSVRLLDVRVDCSTIVDEGLAAVASSIATERYEGSGLDGFNGRVNGYRQVLLVLVVVFGAGMVIASRSPRTIARLFGVPFVLAGSVMALNRTVLYSVFTNYRSPQFAAAAMESTLLAGRMDVIAGRGVILLVLGFVVLAGSFLLPSSVDWLRLVRGEPADEEDTTG